jgi:hypothetical protein
MPLSMVLNKIFLELLVSVGVLNVPVCFKKCLDFNYVSRYFLISAKTK